MRQIVNHAFGFEQEERDDKEISESGSGQCNWWPLHEIKSPHILWATKGNSNNGEQNRDSIKELSYAASILTVADIEKHWIRDILQREFFKYFTPFSYLVAASVGFLILIPHALA